MLPGLAQYQDQLASLIGHLSADALLYPLETVVHRLHMQGCRTIVDNLDSGREVMPILTRYEGFFDCLTTILDEEGPAGLFRGFGALVLQYLVQFAVIRFSATVVAEISRIVAQEGDGGVPPELVATTMAIHHTSPKHPRRPRRMESPPVPSSASPPSSQPPPQVSPSSASSTSSPAGQRKLFYITF